MVFYSAETMKCFVLMQLLLLSMCTSPSTGFLLSAPHASHRRLIASSAILVEPSLHQDEQLLQQQQQHRSKRPTQAPPRGRSMVLQDDYSDMIASVNTNSATPGEVFSENDRTRLFWKGQRDHLKQEMEQQTTLFHQQMERIQQNYTLQMSELRQGVDNLQKERATFRAWVADQRDHFAQRRRDRVHNDTQVCHERFQETQHELDNVTLASKEIEREMVEWQCESIRWKLHLEHLQETTQLVRQEIANVRNQHTLHLANLQTECQEKLVLAQQSAKQQRAGLAANSTKQLQEAETSLHAVHEQISDARQQLHKYNLRLSELTTTQTPHQSTSIVRLTLKLTRLIVLRVYRRIVRPLSLLLWFGIVQPLWNRPRVQQLRSSLRDALNPTKIAHAFASLSYGMFHYVARPLVKVAGRVGAVVISYLWQCTELPRKSLVKQMTYPTGGPAG